MSRPAEPRVLVRRGVDGLLVGWLAVIVWFAVFVGDRIGVTGPLPGLQTVYWTGVVLTAAHFGLSYHLAYRGGSPSMRARPLPLVWGPALLIAGLLTLVAVSLAAGTASTAKVTGLLITLVYLLTTWHYVKQVYGVARVGAAYAGISFTARETTVLRYGLYPLWFLGAAQVLALPGGSYLAGFHFGYDLLSSAAFDALRALAVCAMLPIAVMFWSVTRRHGRLPSVPAAAYVASFLWLGLPTDGVLTLLLLAPFHALQYLAIGHRAELALVSGPTDPDILGPRLGWWLNIFAGAACGGLLLSRWVPQVLDSSLGTPGTPLLFSAAFFVFLNLHHYLIDAAIWRSKGELVKAMVRPGGGQPSSDATPSSPAAPVRVAAADAV